MGVQMKTKVSKCSKIDGKIFQDQTQEEKGMGTYQSGVGVQISTCGKKQKPEPAL